MSFVVGDGHTEVEVQTLGAAMQLAQRSARLPTGPGILALSKPLPSKSKKGSGKTLTTALAPLAPASVAPAGGGGGGGQLSTGAKVGLGLAALFVLFLVFRARKAKKADTARQV